MAESTEKYLDDRVPLVIGVTGHRDLLPAERDLIKERVLHCFRHLQDMFPDLPLMVLTPLAEGADRVAAEAAHELGIPTVFLLPMPQHLYESDFTGDSLDEFQVMLELGERIELPLLANLSEQEVDCPGHARDMQYAQLGAYLAAHSHILLAIWDGKASEAPGGTGHVIEFHQHDVIDLIAKGQHRSPIDFTEDESDLVYHIACSRLESGPPIDGLTPGDAYWFTRNDAEPRTLRMPERYKLVFRRMAEFSVDLQQPVAEAVFDSLLTADKINRCGQGALDINNLFGKADYLSRRYQRLFYATVRWTSGFALLAGCSFVAYADLPDSDFMIYPNILFVVLVLTLAFLDQRFQWQRKFQDYRVLAEGLRVQFYWSLAGVVMENPSRFSHDSFLKRQDLELGWIRNLMRVAGYRADSTDRGTFSEDVDLVTEQWVKDQHDYYHSKATDQGIRHKITGAIGLISFIVVLIAAVLLAVIPAVGDTFTKDFLIVVMGLFPFVFAARQNYALRMAEREQSAQYLHNYRIFANAIGLLQQAPNLEMKRDILRALGEAALDENGQWILRQRERPITAFQPLQG